MKVTNTFIGAWPGQGLIWLIVDHKHFLEPWLILRAPISRPKVESFIILRVTDLQSRDMKTVSVTLLCKNHSGDEKHLNNLDPARSSVRYCGQNKHFLEPGDVVLGLCTTSQSPEDF